MPTTAELNKELTGAKEDIVVLENARSELQAQVEGLQKKFDEVAGSGDAEYIQSLKTQMSSVMLMMQEIAAKTQSVEETMDEVEEFRARRRRMRQGGRKFEFRLKDKRAIRMEGIPFWSSSPDPMKAMAEYNQGFIEGQQNRIYQGATGTDPFYMVPVIDGLPTDHAARSA